MAGRKTHPAVRRFEIVLVAVCLAGLPFALWLPRTLQGKFYATLALPLLALAIALLAAWLQRSRDGGDVPLSSIDLEGWAAPTTVDPTRWSVELLKRIEWQRFETLLAAYFEALEFRVRRSEKNKHLGLELFVGEAQTPSIL